jgi:hypothetical protein
MHILYIFDITNFDKKKKEQRRLYRWIEKHDGICGNNNETASLPSNQRAQVRAWAHIPAKKIRHFSLRYTFFSFQVPGNHRVHFERPFRHNVYRPFTVSVRPRVTKTSIRKKVLLQRLTPRSHLVLSLDISTSHQKERLLCSLPLLEGLLVARYAFFWEVVAHILVY